ncbi:MAG TPA: NTP transferase domain-containing protein, partial [Candidatus Limnocylindrales bacterium]
MAAGLGTRMRSKTPKVLHPLGGRPMLAWVLDAAREATGRDPIVVYSPATERLTEVFDGTARFARQDEPRGTGDAVAAGLTALDADAAEVLVVNGDVPLLTAAVLRDLLEARRLDEAVMILVAV